MSADRSSDPPTLTLAEVRALVERGEVGHLTSDVFDTVVWRPVARPADLFGLLARRLRDDHGLLVDDHAFALARRHAEARARQDATDTLGTPECTLEEIWGQIPGAIFRGGITVADGVAAELAVEAATLRTHPAVAELFGVARDHGVGITLVSDVYLSSSQLTSLLRATGLELDGVEVVTSSERRRNKWSGLLADVVEGRGGAARCVHLGDHAIADVEMAHRIGVRVAHVDVADADDAVRASHEPWRRRSRAELTDGGRGAIVRETLVRGGGLARDPSYQFGAAVAGPLMTGFAGWASLTAEETGTTAIHCLLREGARIAELIDVVRPDGPGRVLVHASRWGIMRAAVLDGSPPELERALARRADLRAEHVTEAFGCETADVVRVIGAATVPRSDRAAAYRAIAADDALRSQIVEAAAELRGRVLRYLERTLRLDDNPLVLCDIGWGGTIQEGITDILRAAGHAPCVVGLYALLSPPGEVRAASGADLRSYLPTIGVNGDSIVAAEIAVRHPEFLERINTPELGTLIGFDEHGHPLTADRDHLGASLALAQRGVLDFARTWAAMTAGDEALRDTWFADRGHAAAALDALATVVAAPDPRVAAALGSWTHDDVAGTAPETLAGSGFGRWVRYANAVDAADITMHDVFWVPGAAGAAGSPLAHQLQALEHGANPETLCPPSATGLARIAVFPPGSTLASAQRELVPRVTGEGWMLLQLTTPVPGARSVRIDVGDRPLLLDVDDVEIRVRRRDASEVLVDGPVDLRRSGTWLAGRWLNHRSAIVDRGGHLLVDLPDGVGVEEITVSLGFRTWPVDDELLGELLPRWRVGAERVRRRGLAGLRRVRQRRVTPSA